MLFHNALFMCVSRKRIACFTHVGRVLYWKRFIQDSEDILHIEVGGVTSIDRRVYDPRYHFQFCSEHQTTVINRYHPYFRFLASRTTNAAFLPRPTERTSRRPTTQRNASAPCCNYVSCVSLSLLQMMKQRGR